MSTKKTAQRLSGKRAKVLNVDHPGTNATISQGRRIERVPGSDPQRIRRLA